MPDRYEYDAWPPPAERLAVCEWLRRHGIDPNGVAVPGWIERQPELYRVAWEAYVLGENGRPTWDPASRDAVREVRYVQLEGPPLPWPGLVRPADVASTRRASPAVHHGPEGEPWAARPDPAPAADASQAPASSSPAGSPAPAEDTAPPCACARPADAATNATTPSWTRRPARPTPATRPGPAEGAPCSARQEVENTSS